MIMIPIDNAWPLMATAIGTLITGLLLALLHWMPYAATWTTLQRYIVGTAAIWIGFTVARLLVCDVRTPLILATLDLSGGLVVITTYRADDNALHARQARITATHDTELEQK